MNNFKSGFVSIIGKPNVGKSTLMNKIIKQKISIVSPKPQTTRNKIVGILNDDDHQIVFIDTPGMHLSKNKLDGYMQKSIESALEDVDVVLYMLDAGKPFLEEELSLIENYAEKNKLILCVNKLDEVTGEKLFKKLSQLNSIKFVKDIVPISAQKGKNIDELLKVIIKYLPFGQAYYSKTDVTDKPVRFIAGEIIREKALFYLQQEVPHSLAISIENYVDNENLIKIDANVIVEKQNHKNIVIGKDGEMLKKIGKSARLEIEHLVNKKVFLTLWVKVKENWKDNEFELKNLGYDKKQV